MNVKLAEVETMLLSKPRLLLIVGSLMSVSLVVGHLIPNSASRDLASTKAIQLASVKTPVAKAEKAQEAKSAVNDALIACIAEAMSGEQVHLKKQRVYEQDFDIVGLACSGEKAKSLYDSIKTKAIAPYKEREVFVRYLGRSTVPSLCTLSVNENQNTYNCLIRLDLSKELTSEVR